MITIERTLTIHRPRHEVFAYLSDVAHGPSYVSGQREAHQTSTGAMGVGTTFTTTGRLLRRSGTAVVTEYQPHERLAWKAAEGAHQTTAWRFEPSGPSTRVTFTRTLEPRGLARLAEPLMRRLANGRVDRDLGTLKELLAVSRVAEGKTGLP